MRMLTFLRYRNNRSIVASITAFAVLFALGLRLCVHGADDGDSAFANGKVVHLESMLDSDDDGAQGTGNQDLPLSLALVKLKLDLSFVSLFTAIFLFGVVWKVLYSRPIPDSLFATCNAAFLRPPLRAPPR